MRLISMALMGLILTSCLKEAEHKEIVGKGDFQVEFLFEKDGCKVYRFCDDRVVYYTSCNGTTSSVRRSGKHTEYDEVQTR